MKHRTPLLCAALMMLLAVSCTPEATDSETAPRTPKQYAIGDFLDTVSFAGSSFSPDMTKLLVRSDLSGVNNAYAVPLSGGDPIALTDEQDSVTTRAYFPNDERFIFEMDRGGNELDHVYVRELDGSLTDLTPGEGNLKASFAGFSQDDETFFVISNERDNRFFDVYEYQVDDYARTMLYENNEAYSFADISPDRRYLAFSKARLTTDSDMFLYDRETKEMKHLSEHEGNALFNPIAFNPDGSGLLYTTDLDAEFSYLVNYDLATGERETVLQPKWDVMGAGFSKSGKYLAVSVNRDARTAVRLFEAAAGKEVSLPKMGSGDITSLTFSPDDSIMAFYLSGSRNPRDLFVYRMGSDEPVQLTSSLNPALDAEDLVEPEVVRFASYDGVEIPGILYKPHGASPDNKVPALVWVHGGPGGQSRMGYIEPIQYLVNHGYAVYMINNRGSSGYGKTFYAMDDLKHGDADLGDVVASKQMLIDTGWVDPERVGIIGGSYGGYMVLAALAFEPEVFDVGVDIFGVANWFQTLENIPPWWESFREALYAEIGDPETDRERLRAHSPVFHAANIVKPLMVLQGANDPRVIKKESDDMVAAVEANDVPVEYIVFEDEGHGFSKKKNRRTGYESILEFLDQHLKPIAAGS